MLAPLMVEATETDPVVLPIAAEVRPVVDMVVLEISARGARRRGAAPAVADEDRIGGEIVGPLRVIPRLPLAAEPLLSRSSSPAYIWRQRTCTRLACALDFCEDTLP